MKYLATYKSKIDDTSKKVYQNADGIIEISLLRNRDYDVICVPTHYYCALGCKMCHLTSESNIEMKKIAYEDLIIAIKDSLKDMHSNRLLISFMGVGEPLLNFELIEQIYDNEDELHQLGFENIVYSLSTMMPNNNLVAITKTVNEKNIPLKVHFSLHSPLDDKRHNLIPNSNVMVEEGLDYLYNYRKEISKNEEIKEKYLKVHSEFDPIELHYTLINGVNDSNFELAMIINYISQYNLGIKFIDFNEKDELLKSNREDYFEKVIKDVLPNAKIKRYNPPGADIGSSCGAFIKYFYTKDDNDKNEYEKLEQDYKVKIKQSSEMLC